MFGRFDAAMMLFVLLLDECKMTKMSRTLLYEACGRVKAHSGGAPSALFLSDTRRNETVVLIIVQLR